jgi:hypothetical protein
MSVFRERQMLCSQCGHANTETVALSLHGPRVPELVERIRSGTFQVFRCAGCGTAYRADGPLIYTDFEEKHWIGEFPSAYEPAWASLEQQPLDSFRRAMIDLAPAFLRGEASGFTIRTVFGLDALAEKLVVLEAGFDDRAVEAAKLQMVLEAGAILHPGYRVRATEVTPEGLRVRAWRRARQDATPEPVALDLTSEQIERVLLDPDWAPVVAELSVGPYVDLCRLVFDGRAPVPVAA